MQEQIKDSEVTFPEIIEQPVMWGYHRELHQTGKYKAIVDADTGKLFSIVSKDYKLIRHEEAIEKVEDTISNIPEFEKFQVKTSFYNDGGRMRRTYSFPDISVEIMENDKVNPELHLFNSYDVTWPFIVLLGAFRFVCANGLVVGKKFLYVRKRHVYGLDQIGLQEEISTALNRFDQQTSKWKEWSAKRLSRETYAQVMEGMKFGKKATEEIAQRIEQETEEYDDNGSPIMSVWIFYNILTWYITHRAVSLNHRVEMENRLRMAVTTY